MRYFSKQRLWRFFKIPPTRLVLHQPYLEFYQMWEVFIFLLFVPIKCVGYLLLVNPGKLTQTLRNFSFPGRNTDQCLENSSNSIEISIFRVELDRSMDDFLKIDLFHSPEFMKYSFSTKWSVLDEFSRNRPVSCHIILELTIGWVFDKSVQK